MDFDIKKGWYAKIEGDNLRQLMESVFGNAKVEGDVVVSSYGLMSRIEAKVVSKSVMDVTTVNIADAGSAPDETILDSKRKLNVFLEEATGFDAKARQKRAKDKAKKGML